LQLQLIDQTGGALRARAEAVAVELGNDELQMRDQRLIIRELHLGGSQFGRDLGGMCPRRYQRRLQGFDVVRKIGRAYLHTQQRIPKKA
jgi:hypothetical protein